MPPELSPTMWAVEYELQEPSAEGRAFDPAAVERMFDADRGTHISAGDLEHRWRGQPGPPAERVGALLDEYPGPAAHDATGGGSAMGAFPALEAHRQLQGVTLVGRDRVDLFRNYIAAIERHEIVGPRTDVFYTEHLYCGEDDLFGSGHPPDTVVAIALAYHAFKTGRQPGDYGVTL